ncbi:MULTISPECIES: AAA family ATPase [unclassified Microcoleus]|uniref:AAA family ATPase n=1 Tax=unclassified Microcoleus TaxID=2642155 RepID=UPI002FD0B425
MSRSNGISTYQSMRRLVQRLRDDLNGGGQDLVLLYAYNRTGKTRLSMAFKDAGKKNDTRGDTLYFNAYTEDLFYWDNDLEGDSDRHLKINSTSRFFSGFRELALEEKIFEYLQRYADFDFRIDYEEWKITFSRQNEQNIKVSRGEENIFIWCIYLAICQLVIDNDESYSWVKYFYIDDPISSLDDNKAIAVASDLARLLKQTRESLKTVISSHHALFFNVIHNEFRSSTVKCKSYFYHRPNNLEKYTLQATDDTPFFHHVAMLSELKRAADSGKLYTYHFNMLRSILEKTAIFFGFKDFSECLKGVDDKILYSRALNLLSHGDYSIYEPREMVTDTKELFKTILAAFLSRYSFALPELTTELSETAKQ